MLPIHQYNMCILNKLGPDPYIADWLSNHNHTEGKDQEIAGRNINIHAFGMAIGVPVCTSVDDIRNTLSTNVELQML